MVREDIGVTIESDIDKTGGNKREKTGVKDENEMSVHGRAVSEDIEGVMTDTEIQQTGGNNQEKIRRRGCYDGD